MDQKYKRSDKRTFFGIKANGPVFVTSLLVIFILVLTTLIVGKPMEKYFSLIQTKVANNTGWFFILLVNILLMFALYLGFSKYGNIRLGGKGAKPEFSKKGWFAMLFSAGMGIGLLFWSVAEPIFHYNSNPLIDNSDKIEAAKSAMGLTFLHWGVHAWAIYAIVGLALAFFTFNKKLPLTIRSIFHPLLGNRIYGPIGDAIDIISVIATIFGLATSLGFGVQQVNAGLNYLFDINLNTTVQIVLIVIITAMATMSLILGLDKGIRRLSEWNMRFAIILLVFVIIVGPTVFLAKSFVQNLGHYLSDFFEISFWTESYAGVREAKHWQNSWTVFYWAWWIAWSPFVGIFIARVSKGRTIKEFILGVLLVPTLLTFIWMSVFGGSALYQEFIGNTVITDAVNDNVATAIYKLLEQYPFAFISSFIAAILVTSFFITSSDSGSLVVDTLTSGGRHDAPVGQKIFWASMEGAVAGILLVGGGLTALQTASILTGLPFAFILIMMCFSFYKSLKSYHKENFTDE
ncbi:BCCT family transporter [Carboxylicivirga linearis]|uniref:BCCT family transporter n=1 Tax=Carboxylicivirga linearis TaxID=1628157 RepID=A0ABS5JRC6_9BACT|nr:BCCT family transporter [Carboxylicivirga linearis]MBS2097446.1 BCCT family transporter [Carboxylicivirga linearis]